MSNRSGCTVAFLAIVAVVAALAITWCATLLVSWIIFLCFGWEWSIVSGTGMWLLAALFGGFRTGVSYKIVEKWGR